MAFCVNCGAEYQTGALFCSKCGTKLPENGNKAPMSQKDAPTVILPMNRVGNNMTHGATDGRSGTGGSPEPDTVIKKSKAPIVLLIAAPVVLIFLVVVVGVTSYFTLFSQSARDRREVNKQLKLAERYLNELDYEQAIAAYKAVLEIDPNNTEALAALNDVYEKWAESDPDAADKIYAEAISYYQDLNERASENTASDLIAQMEQKRSELTGNSAETEAENTIQTPKLTLTIVGANETGVISGADVTVSGSGFDGNAESDGSGKVSFEGLNAGIVTVKVSVSGYNSCEMDVNVSGDTEKVVALIPEISGDDAMVLINWNGDHDLDLCAFNASIKEYVNIGHPMDSEGNVFLYADHGADTQYEVLYIHNASAEVARTFYITEADKARNGEPSTMEADGVSISVYNSTGLVYSCTADTSQSAPLWCPCYYYEGVVYDQGDYIYDTTDEQYSWISFDEKDAYTADFKDAGVPDEVWKQAYLKALNEYYKDWYPDDTDSGFYIGYINDDNIPELIIKEFYMDSSVFSYINGTVYQQGGDTCGGFYYIEGSGKMLFYCEGGDYSGEYYELYKITDTGFSCTGEGAIHRSIPAWETSDKPYGNYDWVKVDTNMDEDVYEAYYWNNVSYRSRSAFEDEIKKELDYSNASDYPRTFSSYNDLIKYLSE